MSEIAIELCRVSKNYKLYEKPSDRVKEVFSLTGKNIVEKNVYWIT